MDDTLEARVNYLENRVADLARHNKAHCAHCEAAAADERAKQRPNLDLQLAEQDLARRRAFAEENPHVRVSIAPGVMNESGQTVTYVHVQLSKRNSFVIDSKHGPFFYEDLKPTWLHMLEKHEELADLHKRGWFVV